MSTTMVGRTGRYDRRATRSQSTGIHIGRLGIGTVGFLTILISAWGGLIPFVGPAFGYSADGSGSWDWSLAHTVLALVPGVIGVLCGVLILGETRGLVVGRGRVSLTMVGLLAGLCGAWFVIGPSAWPVISTSTGYFVAAAPLRALANVVGYGLGTGVILAALGAFAIGWAARHQPLPRASSEEIAQQDTPMAAPAPPFVTAPEQQPMVQQNTPPVV